MAEETEKLKKAEGERLPADDLAADEPEAAHRPRLREIFRQAFEKARGEQKPPITQRQKGRDRGKSLFLLVGAAIAILLLFFGVFSSPDTARKRAQMRRPGTPDLGRRETPGQQATGQIGSVTPLLNADTTRQESYENQNVTPSDVGKTARPVQAPADQRQTAINPTTINSGQYALGQIDFSDPQQAAGNAAHRQSSHEAAAQESPTSDDLHKPSLVFVRSVQTSLANPAPKRVSEMVEESPLMRDLPAGTRLVARFQSVVSSALATPVVATIEYNYERDGEILVPAGAKVLGSIHQADQSGYIAIHFDTLQMPDGTSEKVDAAAMSLAYNPLKGTVNGKKTGTRFLVRTFTGLGTVASYLVGGSNGFSGPLSESALLRDRIATNIGIAGDQELNSLAFNQNITVTIPANTRFYVVLQKGSSEGSWASRLPSSSSQTTNNGRLPSLDELRQLMQLRRELNEMYQQSSPQAPSTQQQPQQ